MFGRGYVMQHCVSALKKRRADLIFRVYITDSLRAFIDKGNDTMPRYYDLITPQEEEEQRTEEEVVASISEKLAFM